MTHRSIFSLVALYICVWIVTFGHAANRPYDCDRSHIVDPGWRAYVTDACENAEGMEALFETLFWPFYWSAQAWKVAP